MRGIKVVLKGKEAEVLDNVLITEYLRYAGVISRPENVPGSVVTAKSIVIYTPKGVNAKVWAEQNIGRLSSFGVHAEIIK